MQVFEEHGITETLDTAQGGGREPHVALPCFFDMNYGAGGVKLTEKARALEGRYYKGVSKRAAETSGVAIPVLTPDRINKRQNGRRFKEDGDPAFTLTAQDRHGVAVGVGPEEEQDGRGIFVELPEGYTVYAVWYEKYQCYIAIRRLTPKECFRLQGFDDSLFEKAAFVNSDSQLYKQAGNAITVDVAHAVGDRISAAEETEERDGQVDTGTT